MRIALDAMGGDHAPSEIVAGAMKAAPDVKGNIILVGDPSRIEACAAGPLLATSACAPVRYPALLSLTKTDRAPLRNCSAVRHGRRPSRPAVEVGTSISRRTARQFGTASGSSPKG